MGWNSIPGTETKAWPRLRPIYLVLDREGFRALAAESSRGAHNMAMGMCPMKVRDH